MALKVDYVEKQNVFTEKIMFHSKSHGIIELSLYSIESYVNFIQLLSKWTISTLLSTIFTYSSVLRHTQVSMFRYFSITCSFPNSFCDIYQWKIQLIKNNIIRIHWYKSSRQYEGMKCKYLQLSAKRAKFKLNITAFLFTNDVLRIALD